MHENSNSNYSSNSTQSVKQKRIIHTSPNRRKVSKMSAMELKKQQLLDLAHKHLTRPQVEDDKYTVIGKNISIQLKEMVDHQRFIAEKLISDIMFYGRMGKLREDAMVKCTNTVPTNNVPANTVPTNTFTAQQTDHSASQHLNIRNIKQKQYFIKTTNGTQDKPIWFLSKKDLSNSLKMKQNLSERNTNASRISL